MSMNLRVEVNGKPVEGIIQTPTLVTYVCLTNHYGVQAEVTGKDAQRAIRCYLEWVKSLADGAWPPERHKEYEMLNTTIKQQVCLCNKLLDEPSLTVFMV